MVTCTWHTQQRRAVKMQLSQSPIDDPSRDLEQPVPGTELPEAEEMEQEARTSSSYGRGTGCRFHTRHDALFGGFPTCLVTDQRR